MFLASIESILIGFPPIMPSVITLRPSNQSEEKDTGNILPISIGGIEASSIAAALEGEGNGRPLTHKLTNNLIHALGGSVARVVIDRVEGSVFSATVYVRCNNGMFTRVDARPSDAIALAIHADVPLFVEESVFTAASCPRSFRPGADEKLELEEFHKFIDDIEPEDFVTSGSSDNAS